MPIIHSEWSKMHKIRLNMCTKELELWYNVNILIHENKSKPYIIAKKQECMGGVWGNVGVID